MDAHCCSEGRPFFEIPFSVQRSSRDIVCISSSFSGPPFGIFQFLDLLIFLAMDADGENPNEQNNDEDETRLNKTFVRRFCLVVFCFAWVWFVLHWWLVLFCAKLLTFYDVNYAFVSSHLSYSYIKMRTKRSLYQGRPVGKRRARAVARRRWRKRVFVELVLLPCP